MAPRPTLVEPSPAPSVTAPALYVQNGSSPGLEVRSTIVFGVLGVFFAAISLIFTGLTLHIMYRAHKRRFVIKDDVTRGSDVDMHTINSLDSSYTNVAEDTQEVVMDRRGMEDDGRNDLRDKEVE